jgi:thiamine-monophosphate kinase
MLYEEKLPVHPDAREYAYKLELDPTACALSGGEDYELLFTIRQEDFDKIVLSENISVIGYITEPEKKVNITTKGGNVHEVVAQGWQHQ